MNHPGELNQPEEWNQPEESFVEFERQLTEALRPVAPPEGFADRVMARAQSSAPAVGKVIRMQLRTRAWASGAIAAAVFAGVFGHQTHVRHERQQAQLAQQQFEAAMRITDQTMQHVRQQLQQAGVPVGD